jgi:crotonobetainyl-CoA:carnitine CoA-transferase CaiB-like acyl-CoA transferase
VDYSGGLTAAASILAALHAARRDGIGSNCDISLFDTAISMLTYPAAWALNGNFVPERTHHSAHPSIVPFQAFESKDGWLVVACPKEKFWRRLVAAIGRSDLLGDERFVGFAGRREHSSEVLGMLSETFVQQPTAYWVAILTQAQVPCGPVNSVADALEDPQIEARGLVVTTLHPYFGEVRQVATAVRVGEMNSTHRRAPRRHENADEILRSTLKYPTEGVRALAFNGAFGNEFRGDTMSPRDEDEMESGENV